MLNVLGAAWLARFYISPSTSVEHENTLHVTGAVVNRKIMLTVSTYSGIFLTHINTGGYGMYIERALRKERAARTVVVLNTDPEEALRREYVKQVAKELAAATITLNALTKPRAPKKSVWYKIKVAIAGICVATMSGSLCMWSFNVGWVLGNEAHQETHIDQAPDVDGEIGDFNRERGL